MAEPASASRWLKSTSWLASRLNDPATVIVDGSYYLSTQNRNAREEYLARHIPGAVFFDINAIADTTTDLPHMLPGPAQFSRMVGALGIADTDTIIVYDGSGLYSAPRVWWTFRIFGAKNVFILDGGFPAWAAENRATESGDVKRAAKRFNAMMDTGAVAMISDVRTALADGSAQMLDARSAGRFTGREPEPRKGLRAGHMPGAFNLPFTDIVENGRLAPPRRIAAAFEKSGVDPDKPIIASCGSGVTAVVLALGLDAIGKGPAKIYDGSWSEWGGRPDCIVVKD